VIKTQHYLRVNCEFLDSATGRFKLSDVRTEIKGTHNIQEYCVHNDIKTLYNTNPTVIEFIHKKAGYIDKQRIQSVDMDDFNFRLSYQTEEQPKQDKMYSIADRVRHGEAGHFYVYCMEDDKFYIYQNNYWKTFKKI
jgi:hypothetical protein